MQRRLLGGLAATLAALPLATLAADMSYTYVDLGYVSSELDDDAADVDGDGFGLRGSLLVHENFFVFAQYRDVGFDQGIDLTSWQVGAGGRWPLSEKLDVVGRFGIVQADLDYGPFDADADGFVLGGRLRGQIAPQFELEGGFDYVDLDDGDDTSLVFEGRYFFLEQLAGGLLLEIADDATTIGINGRFTF